MELNRNTLKALAAPFDPSQIDFLVRSYRSGEALALPYVDARVVMTRLDNVVGPDGWSFDFDCLAPDGKMVKGRLTVLGVTKCDAGEANDEGEPLKSAVSDALKRCGVHFGIARYLYSLPKRYYPAEQSNGKARLKGTPTLDPRDVDRALLACGVVDNPNGLMTDSRRAALLDLLDRAAAAGVVPEAGVQKARARLGTQDGSLTNAFAEKMEAELLSRLGEANEKALPASVQTPQPAPGPANSPSGPAPNAGNSRAAKRPTERTGLECSDPDCRKALTQGQHDVAVEKFGMPYCPACQKARKA